MESEQSLQEQQDKNKLQTRFQDNDIRTCSISLVHFCSTNRTVMLLVEPGPQHFLEKQAILFSAWSNNS